MSSANNTRLGSNISRVLDPIGRNYAGITFECGKPVLDSELNFIGQIQNESTAQTLRARYPSGVLDYRLNRKDQITITTRDPNFVGLLPNQFLIQNFTALINGWVAPIVGSSVDGAQFADLSWLSLQLPTSPTSLSQQAFVFLEAWLANISPFTNLNKPAINSVYRYGNTQYRGTNLPDELVDPQGNIETTRRVQIQYKIRIIPHVDFNFYPNGLGDPTIKPQGPNSTNLSSFTYVWQGNTDRKDPGLWVAGSGSEADALTQGTADGYVYAIPLMAVHRRNSSAWQISNNANGSAFSILDLPTISDRPDGLYYDEVAARDIMDLRMQVVNTDYSSILEENFDSLTRGTQRVQLGPDFTSVIYGSRIMEADGLTGPAVNPPSIPPGVFTFNVADNIRRSFNDSGKDELHTSCLDLANATLNAGFTDSSACGVSGALASSVTVSYQASASPGPKITISLNALTIPKGTVIAEILPSVTWDSLGVPVARLTTIAEANNEGWVGLGTTQVYTFLDDTDPNFVALQFSGIIDVLFTVKIGKGGGFRYVPEQVYYIRNSANGKVFGFNELNETTRDVPAFEHANIPNLPIIGGQQDRLVDYNYEKFTTPKKGYSRLYIGHFFGNGTSVYNTKTDFPPGLFNAAGNTILLYGTTGQTVRGFIKFEKLSAGGSFVAVTTQSISIGADGNFVVTFTEAFSSANVIRYYAVLEEVHCIYTKVSKGPEDFAQVSTLSGTIINSTTATFTAPNGELIYNSFAYDPDGTGINTNYVAYINGTIAIRPVALTGFGFNYRIGSITGFNTNTITVNFNLGDLQDAGVTSLTMVVLHSYTPKSSDLILFYYDHDAYQGNNQSINGSVIRAVGKQVLLHTLGSGEDDLTTRPKYLTNISNRLPLGASVLDADLAGASEIIPVGFIPTTLYKSPFIGAAPSRGTGTGPSEGQKIVTLDFRDLIDDPAASLPLIPARGIAPYLYVLTDKDGVAQVDNYLEVATAPLLNNLLTLEGVWYSLVEHPSTGELLMLVTTGIARNVGTSTTTLTPVDTFEEQIVATAGQKIFNSSFAFTAGGQLLVFRNGVKQYLNRAYIEKTNQQIEFIDPPAGLLSGDVVEFLFPKGSVSVDRNTSFNISSSYAIQNARSEQYLAYDVFRCIGRPTVKPTKQYGDQLAGGVNYDIPSGGFAQKPNFSVDVIA